MTNNQFQGLAREIIFAALAALVSFNLFPETNVDLVGAGVIALAVLVWGIAAKPSDGASVGSLVRKLIQTIAPILVVYEAITPEQGGTLTVLAVAFVSTWSLIANKE